MCIKMNSGTSPKTSQKFKTQPFPYNSDKKKIPSTFLCIVADNFSTSPPKSPAPYSACRIGTYMHQNTYTAPHAEFLSCFKT
eukprot:c16325_g1_i2 orf=207-452(-)